MLSVQSLSCVRLFATPWTAACQTFLSITNSQSLLKLMSIRLVMPSNHLILCCPFSSCPQSFPASGSFPVVLLCPSKSDQGWLCQKLRKPQNLSHSQHASLSALSPSSYHPHPLVGAGRVWGNAFSGELTVWCLCSPLSWELSTPHLEREKKKRCRIGVFWVYFPEFWSISGLHVISRAPHPSLFV